jgi:hypothetical protein
MQDRAIVLAEDGLADMKRKRAARVAQVESLGESFNTLVTRVETLMKKDKEEEGVA